MTPLPLETIRAMTKDIKNNQLSSVMKMFAEGDQKTCSEQATSLVSLLNSDSKQSRKGACCMVCFGFTDTSTNLQVVLKVSNRLKHGGGKKNLSMKANI